METHKKLLSTLHIIYGTFFIALFLIFSAISESIIPFIHAEMENSSHEDYMVVEGIFLFIKGIFLVLLFLIPIPSVIGGIAFMNNKPWGLPVMMISGCLSLLSVPVGTALGVYTIWVYLENNKTQTND